MFRGVSLIWKIPVWIPVRGDRMDGRAVLYYDGECGMCAVAARWAGRLDWLRRLESRGSMDEEARPLGMTSVDLDGAMQLVSPNGETFSGFHALRQVMLRLPLMWPVAPLAWAPGAALAGSWVYRWVAQHRNAWCGYRT